jgi:Rps23 Pro-64 3,4-dihydroxylase Tpa1-like proline 4-hydroxylase
LRVPELLQLNPKLDRRALAAEFARTGRLQVLEVLTAESAKALQILLAEGTPWGLAWQAGASAPAQFIDSASLRTMAGAEADALAARAAADPAYGFAYHSYPLVTAYLERWRPGSPHERLLEELNAPAVLEFMRAITGFREIVKLDGQATLYKPGNFLRPHTDEESQRGRLVAYVLNLTEGDWRREWGGTLDFLDDRGEVSQSLLPRFNSLSLFRVPQWHEVSRVHAAAPVGRYAVTGWARDR